MTEPIEKCNDCESYKAMGARMAVWLEDKDAKIKQLLDDVEHERQTLVTQTQELMRANELKSELKELIKLPPSQLYEKLSELLETL